MSEVESAKTEIRAEQVYVATLIDGVDAHIRLYQETKQVLEDTVAQGGPDGLMWKQEMVTATIWSYIVQYDDGTEIFGHGERTARRALKRAWKQLDELAGVMPGTGPRRVR